MRRPVHRYGTAQGSASSPTEDLNVWENSDINELCHLGFKQNTCSLLPDHASA